MVLLVLLGGMGMGTSMDIRVASSIGWGREDMNEGKSRTYSCTMMLDRTGQRNCKCRKNGIPTDIAIFTATTLMMIIMTMTRLMNYSID